MESHTITLRDGHNVTLFSMKDILEVIDMYCGFDMRNLVRDGIRDLEAENEDLEMQNKDYARTLECNNEEERELLQSIRDETEALLDEMSAPRMNRRKIQRITKTIFRIVNAEL